MHDDIEDDEIISVAKKQEEPKPRKRPKKLVIPKRAPSVVVLPRQPVYITHDKTTCAECSCYPKEDPYVKPKKLNPCQKSPLTLYELSAVVVDSLKFPPAFNWSVDDVAQWMEDVVGLPRYKTSIQDNNINGRRLLLLEDPSHMPMINIHDLDHIKMITSKIRETFDTEFIRFSRSVGLPPRYPLTHCTWFKSRTGPTWGIRQNWDRCDILRWMKIIMPEPVYLDHWDLVWYEKPDFPRVLLSRIPPRSQREKIPHYKPGKLEPCREYLASRKYRLHKAIPDDKQMIWMEHRPGSPVPKETELAKLRKQYKPTKPKKSRLDPPKVVLEGKKGRGLILARRLLPKKKFLDFGNR